MKMVALCPQNFPEFIPVIVGEVGVNYADGSEACLDFDHCRQPLESFADSLTFIVGCLSQPFAPDGMVVDVRVGLADGGSPCEKFVVSRYGKEPRLGEPSERVDGLGAAVHQVSRAKKPIDSMVESDRFKSAGELVKTSMDIADGKIAPFGISRHAKGWVGDIESRRRRDHVRILPQTAVLGIIF
jgi:hypothetical protein